MTDRPVPGLDGASRAPSTLYYSKTYHPGNCDCTVDTVLTELTHSDVFTPNEELLGVVLDAINAGAIINVDIDAGDRTIHLEHAGEYSYPNRWQVLVTFADTDTNAKALITSLITGTMRTVACNNCVEEQEVSDEA